MEKSFAVAVLVVAFVAAHAQDHASLTEQKMCAAQAASVFNAWKSDPDPTFAINGVRISQDHVNHYDVRTHVCYVMTHSTTYATTNSSAPYKVELIYEEYTLTDAFENTEYASYHFDRDSGVHSTYIVTPTGALQPTSVVEFLRAIRRTYGVH